VKTAGHITINRYTISQNHKAGKTCKAALTSPCIGAYAPFDDLQLAAKAKTEAHHSML
jgi:hypothetical protein